MVRCACDRSNEPAGIYKMSNALRTLAVAAAMAGLAPIAAQAAVLATCTPATCLSMVFTSDKFKAGPITEFQPGVSISNAQLFATSATELALVNLVDTVATTTRTLTPTALVVSNAPIAISFTNQNQFQLNALTLDYTSVFDIVVTVKTTRNTTITTALPGGGGSGWVNDQPLTRLDGSALISDANDWITSISFQPDTANGSSTDFIGLNGLDFTQIAVGNNGGGTVPEPTGYGLAALALMAAGVASRRRSAR